MHIGNNKGKWRVIFFFFNKLELMNGCISKAHSNYLYPLLEQDQTKVEEKIKEIWKLQHTPTSVMYKEPLVLEQM